MGFFNSLHMEISSLYNLFKTATGICTDTRQIKAGNIFFALKGERFNGNEFASQAIEQGCIAAIIDQEAYMSEKAILVNDVLDTLTQLAIYHRRQLKIPFIGITGSNGKTTTKELISTVLGKKYKTFFTQGNLNNHIGVPLSVLSVDGSHQLAVIEMGANHPGEIAALCKISMPDFGIITNIGKAHLEGFGSYENVVKAKSELYQYIKEHKGSIFRNALNPLLKNISEGIPAVEYGMTDSRVWGEVTEVFPLLSVKIHFSKPGEKHSESINTKLTGTYNLDNICAAACIGAYFKVSCNEIKEALETYTPINHRSQIQQTQRNTVIIDAYNANPSSMKAALENFFQIPSASKTLILGDMLELGNESFTEHLEILKQIKSGFSGKVILVGKHFMEHKASYKEYSFFENCLNPELLIMAQNLKDNYILLKGSRGIALEKVLPSL